jgi:uncharacterized lipoprotein YddW (UPF0748 family)
MNVLPKIGLPMMLAAGAFAASYEPATLNPPAPPREFRAAWVATVGNIDWPSRKDLTSAEQRSELLNLLDQAAKLRLNAIILQVRPACDALYVSQLEPWSEYLTGAMGRAPEPLWDPLEFAVTEAHRRGLELHAWFNPYRARHPNAKSPVSAGHISKTKPHLVRQYGRYLWLDPGEPEVQEHSLNVVLDVVRRYDVDGVHFDDYFYPYKESAGGKELDFPDEPSWRKHGAGGKLSRADWRRQNVNGFIERVGRAVHAAKPWVKFGVSPFGIWRPGHPPQIEGFDAYDGLYADSRKWLANGWVDYLAPQLYWAIEPKAQSFPALLNWWNEQNPKRRHIWPGLNTTRVRGAGDAGGATEAANNGRQRAPWSPREILSQIQFATKQPVSAGHIHWNSKSLLRSPELQAALTAGPYAQPALVPACPWRTTSRLGKPQLGAVAGDRSVKLSWQGAEGTAWWLLQVQRRGQWETMILPGSTRTRLLDGEPPEAVVLSAIDRAGVQGPPAAMKLKR